MIGALLASVLAISTTQAAATPPPSDTHFAALSARLFPLVGKVRADRLPPAARKLLAERSRRLERCAEADTACVVTGSVWSADEIDAIAAASGARDALSDDAAVPDDGAAAQIRRELGGINSVLRVYGQGQPPRNPKLDGPIESAGQPQFGVRVATAVEIARAGRRTDALDPSIELATSLLDVNDDDEAIAFDPVDARYNQAALSLSAALDWKDYPFTAIVVLGNGPETEGETLSPRGKLRVRLAAARFFSGAAPFIVVTGGAVHPRGTRISEALEMRRALIERYGVPERNIVVEPYARYTSTNLRNSTRRLIALGAPLDRELIVLTDPEHSLYVGGDKLSNRSISELGYFPGRIGRRLSPSEVTLTPSRSSLRVDPADPLDP